MQDISRDPNIIRKQLTIGLMAGPLVVSLSLIQAIFRTGFDWRHHANSQLALGEFGWIQSINFIVCGILVWIFSRGVHSALQENVGKKWLPILFSIFAVCSIVAGLFPCDPMFGFPPAPNTPIGAPAVHSLSWHAKVHNLFGGIGFMAMLVAMVILARHFALHKNYAWMVTGLFTGFVILGVAVYAALNMDNVAHFDYLPMWASWVLMWFYLFAVGCKLRKELD